VAKKTRLSIRLNKTVFNLELPVFQESIFIEDGYKKIRRDTTKDMKKYEPLIFEDCFVKSEGQTRLVSSFDLSKDKVL
jgi:hypothetical protein